jgi:hypothetical protein
LHMKMEFYHTSSSTYLSLLRIYNSL